jgi:hypothetical protein
MFWQERANEQALRINPDPSEQESDMPFLLTTPEAPT